MNMKLWAILGIAVALLVSECAHMAFGCEECDRLRALQSLQTTTTVSNDVALDHSEVVFLATEIQNRMKIVARQEETVAVQREYAALNLIHLAVGRGRYDNNEKTHMAYFVAYLIREAPSTTVDARMQVLITINGKLQGQRVHSQTTATSVQAQATAPCCKQPCTQPCCKPKPKAKCCSQTEGNTTIQVGGFNLSNACGTSFTYTGGVLQNACPDDVTKEQQRADYAINKVIGAASFGCHIRQEVSVPVRSPYDCERYGYPPPRNYYRYPMIFQPRQPVVVPAVAPVGLVPTFAPTMNYQYRSTSIDTRNRVRLVPPGTPSRGCECPDGNGPNGCECDHTCPYCQGLCNAA